MSVVAGVDFGTLSVRVSIFDSARGRLGAGTADYPLVRKKEDPDHATQSHADHMRALTEAMRQGKVNYSPNNHMFLALLGEPGLATFWPEYAYGIVERRVNQITGPKVRLIKSATDM